MKTATIYMHADRDGMWELGEKLGYEGEALRLFSYGCCEVEVGIAADEEGNVHIVSVEGKPLYQSNNQQPEGI